MAFRDKPRSVYQGNQGYREPKVECILLNAPIKQSPLSLYADGDRIFWGIKKWRNPRNRIQGAVFKSGEIIISCRLAFEGKVIFSPI